jgi:hypothetical protein
MCADLKDIAKPTLGEGAKVTPMRYEAIRLRLKLKKKPEISLGGQRLGKIWDPLIIFNGDSPIQAREKVCIDKGATRRPSTMECLSQIKALDRHPPADSGHKTYDRFIVQGVPLRPF